MNDMVGWFAVLGLVLAPAVFGLALRWRRMRGRPDDTDEALHGEREYVDPDASAHAARAWKRPF